MDEENNWGEYNLTNKEALSNFERNYYFTNILYTKMVTSKTNGELYDGTRYKNKKNAELFGDAPKNKLISLGKKFDKSGYLDPEDYGGYNSSNPAYFVIVQNLDKKLKCEFIEIPLRYVVFNNEDLIKEFQ